MPTAHEGRPGSASARDRWRRLRAPPGRVPGASRAARQRRRNGVRPPGWRSGMPSRRMNPRTVIGRLASEQLDVGQPGTAAPVQVLDQRGGQRHRVGKPLPDGSRPGAPGDVRGRPAPRRSAGPRTAPRPARSLPGPAPGRPRRPGPGCRGHVRCAARCCGKCQPPADLISGQTEPGVQVIQVPRRAPSGGLRGSSGHGCGPRRRSGAAGPGPSAPACRVIAAICGEPAARLVQVGQKLRQGRAGHRGAAAGDGRRRAAAAARPARRSIRVTRCRSSPVISPIA